ncbi:MAG TPA: hypothetical protein DIV86_01660 [Alphaproteobacteria bacterium]|nr:hypothetical protein [Alphaproteobacteria bacterium]
MLVEITGEAERIINNMINSGIYDDKSIIVREALEALQYREEIQRNLIEEIREKIDLGAEQSDNNELISDIDANKEIQELKKQYV